MTSADPDSLDKQGVQADDGRRPTRPRRLRIAGQPHEHRGRLRVIYASLYANDPKFGRALLDLYEEARSEGFEALLAGAFELWPIARVAWRQDAAGAWASNYVNAVDGVARRFGLDRLGRVIDGGPRSGELRGLTRLPHDKSVRLSDGHEWIQAWCSWRAERRLAGNNCGPAEFISAAGFGGVSPEIGRVVLREEMHVRGPDGELIRIIDERRRPLVHVVIDDQWDPRVETKSAARDRLLARATREIDAQLEWLERDAEARAYEFRDYDEAERDLTWLFWRMCHQFTSGRIVRRSRREHPEWLAKGRWSAPKAKDEAGRSPDEKDSDRVETAVRRMAQKIGLDLSARNS